MNLKTRSLTRPNLAAIRRWAETAVLWPAQQLQSESLSLRYQLGSGERLAGLLPKIMGLATAAIEKAHLLRPHDVQLLGGYQMALGQIVEMKTGEGKTLTAAFPVIANALAGRGTHVVTVNDYLARRDCEIATPILQSLGLSVGVVTEGMEPDDRRAAYAKDVTYATAKELGFDFLRDRCGLHSVPVQRGHYFALVDEADSILIDEARTPLIIGLISPEEEKAKHCYLWSAKFAPQFVLDRDYQFDAAKFKVQLTTAGVMKLRSLPHDQWTRQISMQTLYQYIQNAIRAHNDYQLDRHYSIVDGKVMIIDEFTGRPAEGRQWQGGLHQAVEAKEGVEVSPINRSAARVTLQNFFLRYQNFSGMTGTAWTSRRELKSIFRKKVFRVPTHRPIQRKVLPPRLFCSESPKWRAIVDEVQKMLGQGRPVLIGTRTIDHSERLSTLLSESRIDHQVLNARHIQREADIISQAGQVGRVTVATNMAGRGTDIKLAEEVVTAGGLHVILTEMHESARVDWQLIGRGCRQGDPGSFRIFASLDDYLIRSAWGLSKQQKLQAKFSDEAELPPRWISTFRKAQQIVERRHYSDRLVLMRIEKDRRQASLDAGQDPYLAFNE